MNRFKGKVAIVTGASSGIGEAIAKKLVQEGLLVVALARRKDKLLALGESLRDQPGKLHAQEADVTSEEDVLRVFEWTKQNLGPIHVLVNNAGIGRPKTLLTSTGADLRSILETNVFGLCVATREAVNNMIENDVSGHVVHVNSVSGHYVPWVPMNNAYPASKHAVTALTETLRQELVAMGSKIKVSSVSPGYVHTDFLYSNGHADDANIAEILKTVAGLNSDDVADAVL